MNQQFLDWIKLRKESIDEFGEKLCYCGHTHKCSCGDPDEQMFIDHVRNGNIIPGDPNNGWKTKKTMTDREQAVLDNPEKEKLSIGDLVLSKRFGVGRVMGVEEDGCLYPIKVGFPPQHIDIKVPEQDAMCFKFQTHTAIALYNTMGQTNRLPLPKSYREKRPTPSEEIDATFYRKIEITIPTT